MGSEVLAKYLVLMKRNKWNYSKYKIIKQMFGFLKFFIFLLFLISFSGGKINPDLIKD